MGKTPFKMKGNPMQRNFGVGSPMKLRDVLVENEDGVMVNMGTGPKARAYAAKIARENKALQEKQDDEGIDVESEEYDLGKKIEFTDEDKDINEQALLDLQEMDRGGVRSTLYKPESTSTERRHAIATHMGTLAESEKQRIQRLKEERKTNL